MTTYWIERRMHTLAVFRNLPTAGECSVFQIPAEDWSFAGLPHEIAPGECWEVKWERMSVGYDYVTDTMRSMIVPIARDVTAELKEKSDG